MGVSPSYALHISNPSTCWMLTFGDLRLNHYYQFLLDIPSHNGVALVCVSSASFIFSWLMDSPHSCIINIHAITTTSSYYVNTPHDPILMDLVFPFMWFKWNFIGMFHELLALFRAYVLFQQHSLLPLMFYLSKMPFLVVENIISVVVLIFRLVVHKQAQKFPYLLQGVDYPFLLLASPTSYFVTYKGLSNIPIML